MNPALLLLLVYSVRGRLLRSVRLLKQPRYFVGFIVFALWIGLWVGRPALSAVSRGSRLAFELPDEALRLIQLGVAVLLAAGVTVTWLLPAGGLSLGLSAGEIELLSSAPVRRRELIQHAIVKNQVGIVFGAAMMTLLMGGGGFGARLLWFVSYWLILTNGDLHGKGRTLFKARLGELPWARARLLCAAAIAVGVAFWGIVCWSIAGPARRFFAELPVALESGAGGALLSATTLDLADGAHRWLLAPILWLLEPCLALLGGDAGGMRVVLTLAFGLGLVLLQNEWVVRGQFKFEESAIAHARRESLRQDPRARYRRISADRRKQAPFVLRPRGAPGPALLWKGMLQVRRGSLARNAGAGALLAVTIGIVPAVLGAPPWVSSTILVTGLMFLGVSGWVMPMHPRNDLRTDLLRLEVIRPWPLPGWQVFGWEVLGPAIEGVLAAGFAACLIVSTDVGLQIAGGAAQRLEIMTDLGLPGALSLPLLVLGLLPVAAGLSLLTAVLINLVVMYMPGWVPLGPHRARGAAAFGHNLLLSVGLLLSFGVVFGAAAMLVGSILLLQLFVLGLPLSAWELPFLGLVAALPAVVSAAIGIRIGGVLWEGLDASREILDQAG